MDVQLSDLTRHIGFGYNAEGIRVMNSILVDTIYVKNVFATVGISSPSYTGSGSGLPVGNISLNDGTVSFPSLSFTNMTNTGLYKSGSGMGITVAGVNRLDIGAAALTCNATITSATATNLSINSSTSTIDFNGCTAINLSGFSSNPNRYDVIAPTSVTTINATPTLLYNIPTVSNSAYTLITDVACCNVTDGSATAGFTVSVKAKNIAGTVTTSVDMEDNSVIDASLSTIHVDHGSSGVNVTVMVTGKAATTIKWFGATLVTRQLF